MSSALATNELIALASPTRGRSIAGAVARVIEDVHLAVAAVSESVEAAGVRLPWLVRFPGDVVAIVAGGDFIKAANGTLVPSGSRVNWAISAERLRELFHP